MKRPIHIAALLVASAAVITTISVYATEPGQTAEPSKVSASAGVSRYSAPATLETEAETVTEFFTETEFVEETTVAETHAEFEVDAYAAELIGRTIWGEAGGVKSKAERAAVAWCILNRVDAWGQTIEYVVTKPYQFQGYRPRGECPQEHIDLAIDVLTRWAAEKQGATDVGRVLPADYLFFMGDGEHNHFSTEYQSTDYWGWSLIDPYK